jgi:hypothetical protein
MLARAVNMLVVAVHLPASAAAPLPSGLEPEASAGAESVITTHVADATDLRLTTKRLLVSIERGERRPRALRRALQVS